MNNTKQEPQITLTIKSADTTEIRELCLAIAEALDRPTKRVQQVRSRRQEHYERSYGASYLDALLSPQ